MKYFNLVYIVLMINSPLLSQKIWQVFDTITFEKPCNYLNIDTSSNNIWQIGKPEKLVFNSAYSPVNAIVTDTIGNYPVSNHSFFDVKIGTFNLESYNNNLFVGIKHKFDTDRLKDGGYITASYDGGSTWFNIVNDTTSANSYDHCWPAKPGFGSAGNDFNNLYTESDTLFNGEYGFSGLSDGWVNTWFSWHCYLVQQKENSIRTIEEDTMILRFNFISDSIDSGKDGWMIDDILLFAGNIGSATKDQLIQNLMIFPNPTINNVTLVFNEYQNDINFTVYNTNGDAILKKHHQSGKAIEIESDIFMPGFYFVKIYSENKTVNIGKFIVK